MQWEAAFAELRMHLKLERSLSDRTVEAYLRDLGKLRDHAIAQEPPLAPDRITQEDLQGFITAIGKAGLAANSQARVLSALRVFHRNLLREKAIKEDPTEMIESPRLGRKLPVFLSVQ